MQLSPDKLQGSVSIFKWNLGYDKFRKYFELADSSALNEQGMFWLIIKILLSKNYR
jgi:hypothetical protein